MQCSCYLPPPYPFPDRQWIAWYDAASPQWLHPASPFQQSSSSLQMYQQTNSPPLKTSMPDREGNDDSRIGEPVTRV